MELPGVAASLTNCKVRSADRSPPPVRLLAVATRRVVGVPPRFVRAAAAEVAPVPPLATTRVPAKVIVPEPVMGPPEVVRPVVPPLTATLVTVPRTEAYHPFTPAELVP